MEYEISPVYKMELSKKVEKEIWNRYKSYKDVEQYIELNQTIYNDYGYNDYDFYISYFSEGKTKGKVNLAKTLSNIAKNVPDKLLKMAIDLGIETPDYIPSIPTFRNELKADYKNASTSFEKAFQNIEEDPAESVGYANSVLESIIKEILKDQRFDIDATKLTNGKLVKAILKEFGLSPNSPQMPDEIKSIGSSLTTVSKAIEDLRSDKTSFHGHDSEKYLIDEPLYAYFIVNACATVGLFLINFYEKKFPKEVELVNNDECNDLPF
ncbi:abortive infection family protein [Streptococcus mutans]|uniref:abortive infection family protein n=1 Tax=Streptococcus mutans TaxID=1309 RepID=UPI0028E9D336|nr:abortive infection family protein [Streptococcus mutans]MDT9523105.1 abortive infection family protein [Streptococcus mutans]MDT9525212.1 abortive infection family protein [Streptococcus mutans]MDT9527073.1 abortive infection family protein [Streptococcus mutans]